MYLHIGCAENTGDSVEVQDFSATPPR